MCQLVEGVPVFELRKGLVFIRDSSTERAMLLGDFVAATKLANQLCRQWVAEANQPSRVDAFKAIEAGEAGHR